MSEAIKIKGEPSEAGDSCQFIIDRPVLAGESVFFHLPEAATSCPLAAELLGLPGVKSVLISEETITLRGKGPLDWPALGTGDIIRKHLASGAPLFDKEAFFKQEPSELAIRAILTNLFETEVNPALASHGGFVELAEVKGKDVFIRLGGGCQGCASSRATLRFGIESSIRDALPYIEQVLDSTDHAAGENPYYPR
jgi:NFU1 iron-sulfur cluster scaffold homolog, mitochondrial